MKQPLFLIGLVCIVLGTGCLLLFYTHEKKMSDTSHPAAVLTTVNGVNQHMQATTTTIEASTSLSIPAIPAPTPPASSTPATAKMTFEVVATQAEQNRGLGGRSVIPDNYAMLFVFPTDGLPGFWMKDMLTSIDMIWLTDNGTIVAIDGSVSPSTYPNVFYPPSPIRYVLETRAGFAAEKNWRVGTQVTLPLPY